MDDLFKKAAENYPLDTGSANWNKVLGALQNKTETQSQKEGVKKGRFLWLLLLLPLGYLCNRLYSPENQHDQTFLKTTKTGNRPANEFTTEQKDVYNNNIVTSSSSDDKNDIIKNINHNSIGFTKSNEQLIIKNEEATSLNLSATELKKSYLANEDLTKRPSRLSYEGFSNQQKNNSISENDFRSEESFRYRNYVNGIYYKEPLEEFSTAINKSPVSLLQLPYKEIKQNIQVGRQKKFYAGLTGGIDATAIKFQKIENLGAGSGIILGYQLNKKWSIETGAHLEKKYYYTDGKYFNTGKIVMPPNSWIDDASGDCKMIEVPLALKYNFSTYKNSGLFATMGISSYFMLKEEYTYNYYYGTVGPVPHKKQYKNSSVNLFSALSLSGGYTHRLGNFDVRIEPYLKLPVSGMGIGKLPFFSTGLQVGITKKF
jgi:hypothetical protein